MSFQVNVDFFGDSAVAGKARPAAVEQGRAFFVIGWAVDAANGVVARSVRGIVDGTFRVTANLVVRPDVAAHFGNPALAGCGFDLGFNTQFLAAGPHRIALEVEAADGSLQQAGVETFAVLPAGPEVSKWPRILVAAAPKSGSNFTRSVLKKYFGTEDPPPGEQAGEWNLDALLLERLRGRSFVTSMHMKPHEHNLVAAKRENIVPVVTWRNLGDTLVSFDDHIRNRDETNIITHIDRPKYLAMPDQARYQFLIRHVMPWFLSFYVGWKNGGALFAHYEPMARDPFAAFSELIERLGATVDAERLRGILARPMTAGETNKNVGTNDRSLDKLSPETRAMLEELLLTYFEPLDELLAELPWRAAPRA